MTREAREFRCPEEVLGWIPWYADGSLSEQQKGRVEAHAAECGDCRAELDIVAGAPFEIDVELPDPDRLFKEITARIEAGDRESVTPVIPIDRARRLGEDDLERIERWVLEESSESTVEEAGRVIMGPWAPKLSWVAAAAMLLLFLGGTGGAILSSLSGRLVDDSTVAAVSDSSSTAGPVAPIYELATATPLVVGVAGTQASSLSLDVVFEDSASAREISDALREVGVEIVSGPTNLGVYRLRLTAASAEGRMPTAADVAAIANRLKASGSRVAIFAEAVP